MAKINVSNLHPVGSDLFSDSENYISELSDNELGTINGGLGNFSAFCTVPPPLNVIEKVKKAFNETATGILLNQ
jgi:hypothetical protein